MTRERSHDRRALGLLGERLAAEHLEREGYRIIARNVRPGGVEIDLIAARGRLRVFVEVKTRASARHGPPETAVDGRKQARIARGAAAWLRECEPRSCRVRFDVIAIQPAGARNRGDSGPWTLRHWPGAFDAPSSP